MGSSAARIGKTCPVCKSIYDLDAVFCPKDGVRLESTEDHEEDPYIGTVISADIQIQSVTGQGAMGRVYRAHQKGIDRTVAVKILHRELSGNSQLVHRFHREAKIASKLQHPHVVEVHLAGQLPDGSMYIVMEFLDGKSLGTVMSDLSGTIPLSRALQITMQICDAVGEGHALGIVHRDLKPENVMLVRRAEIADWVKVLDFGIARVQLGEQSMETAAGKIFGTARYISPEGAAGAQVGAPGDVYALATMLYQMMTGRTPFDAAPLGLLIKHIHEPPPPLKTLPNTDHVPDSVARVIMENLAKDPEKRAPNARAFGTALAAAANAASIHIPEVNVVGRMSNVPPAPALEPTLKDQPAPIPKTLSDVSLPPVPMKSSRRWIAIVLAFVLGIALTVVIMSKLGTRDNEHHAYIERTRAALTDGHYVAPPGENVYDLVEQGLKHWPNDIELKQMRSEAEHEMITMAMAARESGDLVGARDLSRDAYKLDSTDNSARFMRAQADDDLASIASGASVSTGAPRLIFESPPVVKTGEKVEMKCRIVPGAAGAKAKISNIKLSIFPNGETTGAAPVAFTSTDPSNVRAVLTAPAVGSWDVTFEATVDGVVVRAMRDLDVTQ